LQFDDEAGFLENFSAGAVFDGFGQFEEAAGGFPAAVVAALDDEGAALVVDRDGGDADAVERDLAHSRAPVR
jgi:hypothetical protein